MSNHQYLQPTIDQYVESLREFYSNSSRDYFDGCNLPEKLGEEEQVELNQKLDLMDIIGCVNDNVISELLSDKTKDNFSFYLLRTTEIVLNVDGVSSFGKTVFISLAERIFENPSKFSEYCIMLLFRRGYNVIEHDDKFVKKLHSKIKTEKDLHVWTYLRAAVILNDADKYELLWRKSREFFSILSFKLGRPVYFNFSNLLGVANNAIQYYRESGDLILKAISNFGRLDKIVSLDARKNTFKSKRKEYLENKPMQDKRFEGVIYEIFPELS